MLRKTTTLGGRLGHGWLWLGFDEEQMGWKEPMTRRGVLLLNFFSNKPFLISVLFQNLLHLL
jgi:hypothetical protein